MRFYGEIRRNYFSMEEFADCFGAASKRPGLKPPAPSEKAKAVIFSQPMKPPLPLNGKN